MKILKIMVFLTVFFSAVLLTGSTDTFAQTSSQVKTGVDAIGGSSAPPLMSTINTVINVVLFLIGAVSVIMIIYGGFRYTTSGGESSAIASAKNTILYAVVGLVVAILSFAIINFVIDVFDQTGGKTIENSNSSDTDGSAPIGG